MLEVEKFVHVCLRSYRYDPMFIIFMYIYVYVSFTEDDQARQKAHLRRIPENVF